MGYARAVAASCSLGGFVRELQQRARQGQAKLETVFRCMAGHLLVDVSQQTIGHEGSREDRNLTVGVSGAVLCRVGDAACGKIARWFSRCDGVVHAGSLETAEARRGELDQEADWLHLLPRHEEPEGCCSLVRKKIRQEMVGQVLQTQAFFGKEVWERTVMTRGRSSSIGAHGVDKSAWSW